MKPLMFFLFIALGANLTGQNVSQDIGFVTPAFSAPSFSATAPSTSGSAELHQLLESKKAGKTVLGYSKNNQAVEAHYFPGAGNGRALIIGGMHGSELSSVEVAETIIAQLKQPGSHHYDVIVIPSLFPDNALKASSPEKGPVNKGRYTNSVSADPNRQMPPLGQSFNPALPFDMYGREIEKENQLLLQLIQQYRPSRIVNLHAINDVTRAGIYADPRTDCNGMALGFSSDSSLAVSMAKLIFDGGGKVPGNRMESTPSALYYNDPCAAMQGREQKRNLHGSMLPHNRGYGVSLGSWATTAVCEGEGTRAAMRLITVEFPGYKAPSGYAAGEARERCERNIVLYAEAVVKVFLAAAVSDL